MLWTFRPISFIVYVWEFLFYIYLVWNVCILGYVKVKLQLFSKLLTNLHSHQQFSRPCGSTSFPTLGIINLFTLANQRGTKSYLTVVLICTSLSANDVEHLFVFLLILSVSYSVKFLSFAPLPFFPIGFFVLFLICSCFYVFLTLILC